MAQAARRSRRPSTDAVPARAPRDVVSKAEQSRRTRDLLIETGIRCLAEYGYAQTTMLLISQEAGVSRGPLHYHFRDKNDLMSAIAEALPGKAPAQLRERLAKVAAVEDRLVSLIDIALEEHTGPHHLVAIELLIAARNDPDLAEALGPHLDRGEQAIDLWWLNYLAALDRPPEELLALRHVAVACLRGLALNHVLHRDEAAHARALALFRRMFLEFATPASREQKR
jgi:AcrR family transcriptional regulator